MSVDRLLSKAKSHAKKGKLGEAEELYRSILGKFPGNKRAQQGLAMLRMPQAASKSGSPTQEQVNALITLYNQRRLQEVVDHATALAKSFPKAIILFNILGAANTRLGHFDAAIASYKQAIKINPNYAEAHNNLGVALKNKCDFDAAIRSHNRAIKIERDYAEAYYNLGIVQREKGDLVGAIESYNCAIKLKPRYVEAHYNLGIALKDKGDQEAAIDSYNRAIQIEQGFVEAHLNLGESLNILGRIDEAIASFENAIQINPTYAEAYNNLGNVYQDKGDITAALKNYAQALHIKPDFTECCRNYATAGTVREDDPLIGKMRAIDVLSLSDKNARDLHFALGKVENDLGNYERGIDHIIKGNAFGKKSLNYDIIEDEDLFSSIKQYFDNDAAHEQKNLAPNLSASPIFILGMPRSGTTLIEQIVSSHSCVYGAGELEFLGQAVSDSNWKIEKDREKVLTAVRSSYLQKLSMLTDAPVITDKMPLNFRWIAFILNALPEAKIVHLNRDSAAICWSNFKTYFPSRRMAFTNDQRDVARYYKLYEDLMGFWRQKYPGKIYDLNYEQLTVNQEDETRKLFDYFALEWEENVLEFHKTKRRVSTASNIQVRQKMYTGSSLEWKNYEQWLHPMLEILNG